MSSVAQLNRYFENLINERLELLEASYDARYSMLTAEMRYACHSELLEAEEHIGSEYTSVASRLNIAEDEVARTRRQAACSEASMRQSLRFAVST